MGTPCLAGTRIPEPRRSAGASINHIPQLSLKALPLSVQGIVGTLRKLKCLDASQGPTLPAGLCKDSSLRPAWGTLVCTHLGEGHALAPGEQRPGMLAGISVQRPILQLRIFQPQILAI